MASAVRVRGDYEAAQLRALAAIYDGGSRAEAARLGGVGLQTVRDWVLAFNAEGPPGLVNGKAPGNAPPLTQAHRQALLEIVESGPIPAVHGVVRRRLIDLAQWVFEEFRISISKQTLSRELRALELRKLSARPRHHAQDAEAMAAFKKTSPRASTRSPSAMRRASRYRSGSRACPGEGRGRGPDRSEEQDHPALGAARDAAFGTARSADTLDLHRRRHLPGARNRGRPRPAALQHRRDGAASGGNLPNGDAGSPRRSAARSGRLAPFRQARHPRQHHPDAAAAEVTRTQPRRKYRAVHARQLALQSRLPLLRRHP